MTRKKRPTIVCLIGSTRFKDEYRREEMFQTLEGKIVLSCGVFQGDKTITANKKRELDELHLRKIDMADYVMVINPDDYIGQSTAREILYARSRGKAVSFTHWHEPREFTITLEKGAI